MGIGDEIMAGGQARRHFKEHGRRVLIVRSDKDRAPRWHDVWDGLDYIIRSGQFCGTDTIHLLKNDQFCRPYIEYPFTYDGGLRWTGWRARDYPAEIIITAREDMQARALTATLPKPFYVIEPNIPAKSNVNKDWGLDNWQQLVAHLAPVMTLVQLGAGPRLAGVAAIETPTFRDACAILALSEGYIGAEGGLHHAANALGRRAVVLFGSYIDPMATGYPAHLNITTDDNFCGSWKPCEHCAAAWRTLHPAEVSLKVKEYFL